MRAAALAAAQAREHGGGGVRPAILTAAVLGLGAWGCGDAEDPLRWRDPEELRTVLLIESAPPGLSEAVVVDSASWFPAALLPTGNENDVEVEGPFRIGFRNTSDQPLQMRYDLRFFEEGGFLVDWFIPFGQPVVFAAGQAVVEEGTFLVRTTPTIGRFGLAEMRIGARLTFPDQQEEEK